MNLDTLTLTLLVLGFTPHHISRRVVHSRRIGERRFVRYQVQALFWRLTIVCPPRGRRRWRLSVPAIRRMADAVWAALRSLLA